jgi:hypothetical protein
MICRLFIDEVGNSDLNGSAQDDNVRYLSLTGVLTTIEFHDKRIKPGLDALKLAALGTENVILHRREIVRREGKFAILRDEEPRRIFDEGLRLFISDMPYLATTVTIDKRAHLSTYAVWRFDPYHYCLTCLIERYVSYLNRHNACGDVAIEPRFKKSDRRVKQSFALLYDQGTTIIPAALMQKRLLSRDIQFEPKRSNVAAMQLCDVIAHPSYRDMKFEREGIPIPADFGTGVVNILNEKKYARHPGTLKIEGWGRKWLP